MTASVIADRSHSTCSPPPIDVGPACEVKPELRAATIGKDADLVVPGPVAAPTIHTEILRWRVEAIEARLALLEMLLPAHLRLFPAPAVNR